MRPANVWATALNNADESADVDAPSAPARAKRSQGASRRIPAAEALTNAGSWASRDAREEPAPPSVVSNAWRSDDATVQNLIVCKASMMLLTEKRGGRERSVSHHILAVASVVGRPSPLERKTGRKGALGGMRRRTT